MWCAACRLPVTAFDRGTCSCADPVLTSEPQGQAVPAARPPDFSGVVQAVIDSMPPPDPRPMDSRLISPQVRPGQRIVRGGKLLTVVTVDLFPGQPFAQILCVDDAGNRIIVPVVVTMEGLVPETSDLYSTKSTFTQYAPTVVKYSPVAEYMAKRSAAAQLERLQAAIMGPRGRLPE